MNNIVRLITKSSKYFSINPQYKMLKILKLDEIYKLELAKFMHNLHHNNLPFIFKSVVSLHEYTGLLKNNN